MNFETGFISVFIYFLELIINFVFYKINSMKTYILNSINRLINYSQNLDASAVLFDKSWEVFNESGEKELMIFRANSELLISRNGIIQKGKWELLDFANMIIDVGEKSYLLNATYVEEKLLALKLDGTKQYMIMIEANMKNRFFLNSIESIENYLELQYVKMEEKEKKEEEKIRLESIKQAEKEIKEKQIKKEKEEEQRILKEETLKLREEKIEKYGIRHFYVSLILFVFSLFLLLFIGYLATYDNKAQKQTVLFAVLSAIFLTISWITGFSLKQKYDDMKLAKKLRKDKKGNLQ